MLSACAQLGILAAGLIARRHNAARVSMMSFSSAETRAESMCYHRRAYAPRTQVIALGFSPARGVVPGLGFGLAVTLSSTVIGSLAALSFSPSRFAMPSL